MTAVPSSVELAKIDAVTPPADVEKPAGERWLLYVGTLIRERKLELLVRVLERVRAELEQADVRLVLVGKGEMPEDERAIRAEAERLGLADRVTITGWMPIERAWGYIKLAD